MTTLITLLTFLPVDAQAGLVEIANVTSKSDYNEAGVNYPASNLKDRKSTTPWFEGESGNGLGAWVELDFGGTKTIKRLVMYGGNWENSTEWDRANRPKEVEVTWSDGSTQMWNLDDEFAPQSLVPEGGSKSASSVKLTLKQVYTGTAFPDTGISEVVVFDDQGPSPLSVNASSEFPRDASGVYMPALAADSLRDTFWCENDKAGAGEGEWVEITLAKQATVTGLEVCSGMCAGMDVHKKGNAPTEATVLFSDGSTEKISIKPFPLPKKIAFKAPHATTSVKVSIDAVRKGTEYNDGCFSEILPY